ncbi:zinc-finger domain-containing protein [Kangiella sp. TOML190]|uniref:zinc-finger domain-containing protein n=1 Tax=Kangiella sp. TOML190 TaxID=2931351 RepID=UPI00203FD76E|nr:zinc-finger domain-containing protein [Kangiella sp. TOML190]
MATDSSTKTTRTIGQADLPLSCPMPDEALWNQHPRVYIPLDKQGRGACPYCGNQFQLKSAVDSIDGES